MCLHIKMFLIHMLSPLLRIPFFSNKCSACCILPSDNQLFFNTSIKKANSITSLLQVPHSSKWQEMRQQQEEFQSEMPRNSAVFVQRSQVFLRMKLLCGCHSSLLHNYASLVHLGSTGDGNSRISLVSRAVDCREGCCEFDSRDWTNTLLGTDH